MNVCPECGKDDQIQKLSVIYSSGQSSGMFSGPTGGVAHVDGKWGTVSGYTSLSGKSISNLAQLLSPPPEPALSKGFWVLWGFIFWNIASFIFLGIICTLISIFAAITTSTSDDSNFPAFMLIIYLIGSFSFLALGVGAFLIAANVSRKKKLERDKSYIIEKRSWERAIINWDRLYFCYRDGIVFDHLTNEKCQPQQVREFVYKG